MTAKKREVRHSSASVVFVTVVAEKVEDAARSSVKEAIPGSV